MPRHLKISLAIVGVVFVIALGSFMDIVGRVRSMVDSPETDANPFEAGTSTLYSPTDPTTSVKLFVPASGGPHLLASRDDTIFQSQDVVNRAKQILEKTLATGPTESAAAGARPQRVQELFVSDSGLAFVDLNPNVSQNHPGGIRNEQATIYSIVNSLTYNLPEIRRVKILIGGTEKETLAGHCLLLLPLEPDFTLTDTEAPTERTAGNDESR